MCIDFATANNDNLDLFLAGHTKVMVKLRKEIVKASKWNSSVVIEGETGTGKELVANLVFILWKKRYEMKGSFVTVDCATLRGDILLSKLFGHTKGAFTDAKAAAKGVFETANEGAVFFDELGNLPKESQANLLRVLESKEFTAVGSNSAQTFSTRYISATNANLHEMVEQGSFRRDLFNRLHDFVIHTPALRTHLEDIPVLVANFLRKKAEEIRKATGISEVSFSAEAMDLLCTYSWPGNVRELQSVLNRALFALDEGEHVIKEEHIDFDARSEDLIQTNAFSTCKTLLEYENVARTLAVTNALREADNNVSQAAAILGVNRSSFYKLRKMLKL